MYLFILIAIAWIAINIVVGVSTWISRTLIMSDVERKVRSTRDLENQIARDKAEIDRIKRSLGL